MGVLGVGVYHAAAGAFHLASRLQVPALPDYKVVGER